MNNFRNNHQRWRIAELSELQSATDRLRQNCNAHRTDVSVYVSAINDGGSRCNYFYISNDSSVTRSKWLHGEASQLRDRNHKRHCDIATIPSSIGSSKDSKVAVC